MIFKLQLPPNESIEQFEKDMDLLTDISIKDMYD